MEPPQWLYGTSKGEIVVAYYSSPSSPTDKQKNQN
jgi:hypothetical protein